MNSLIYQLESFSVFQSHWYSELNCFINFTNRWIKDKKVAEFNSNDHTVIMQMDHKDENNCICLFLC